MNYLYINPIAQIKQYNTAAFTINYLFSPELLDFNTKKEEKQFVINHTAVEIISLYNGTRTYDDIINFLVQKYAEPYELIDKKVKKFIKELTQHYGYSILEQAIPKERGVLITIYENLYPTVASIELTTVCNLHCRHCYGQYGNDVHLKHISSNDMDSILNSLGKIDISILELTGGDPTLYPYCAHVIEKAFSVGITTVMLLTNGVSFSEELIETIIKYKENIYLQIDLHSLKENYYDWFTGSKGNLEQVKKNIIFLIGNGVKVRICAIITPGNILEMAQIGEWAYEHGAISYAPSIITALGRAKLENKDLFFSDAATLSEFKKQHDLVSEKHPGFIQEIVNMEQITRKNCGAVTSQVSINVDGNIKLCNMDCGDHIKLNLGNAVNQSVKKIFDENTIFINKLMEIALPDFKSEDCINCEEKLFCTNCLLRGFIGAKKLERQNKQCNWFNKIDQVVKEKFEYV